LLLCEYIINYYASNSTCQKRQDATAVPSPADPVDMPSSPAATVVSASANESLSDTRSLSPRSVLTDLSDDLDVSRTSSTSRRHRHASRGKRRQFRERKHEKQTESSTGSSDSATGDSFNIANTPAAATVAPPATPTSAATGDFP